MKRKTLSQKIKENNIAYRFQIKCGSTKVGTYLLDDIRDRLNERFLDGSCSKISSITCDDQTWITVDFVINSDLRHIIDHQESLIGGMVIGILIWSGVDVI